MSGRSRAQIIDAAVPSAQLTKLRDGSVVTIGNFDGVHLGHQAILADARERADASGLPLVALTFDPHPAALFRGVSDDTIRLTTNEERAELLRAHGVNHPITITFTREFASLEAEDFARELLIARLNAREVHIGYDFNFGRGRRGDARLLRDIGAESRVDVREHSAVLLDGTPVSSTRVRERLRAGDMPGVARLLRRPWSVAAVSEHGAGRGRGMGIPTVNVYPSGRLLPPHGVYATTMTHNATTYRAISNLGVRPTFDDGEHISLETLALEAFPDDVHGDRVTLAFHDWIRPERAFPSVDDLKAQIASDVAAANSVHADLHHAD